MIARLSIDVKGAVQGVGFRPFVHRIANELRLDGYVLNSPYGVKIEVEGERSTLEKFLSHVHRDKPTLAIITSLEYSFLDPIGYSKFDIRKSDQTGETQTLIMPDISLCNDCLKAIPCRLPLPDGWKLRSFKRLIDTLYLIPYLFPRSVASLGLVDQTLQ